MREPEGSDKDLCSFYWFFYNRFLLVDGPINNVDAYTLQVIESGANFEW